MIDGDFLQLARSCILKALENLTDAHQYLIKAGVSETRIKRIEHTISALQNRNKESGSILPRKP